MLLVYSSRKRNVLTKQMDIQQMEQKLARYTNDNKNIKQSKQW
jgi:hypothetical protein